MNTITQTMRFRQALIKYSLTHEWRNYYGFHPVFDLKLYQLFIKSSITYISRAS